MTSALILMTVDSEQIKLRPISDEPVPGHGDTQDVAFAKAFNERVGVSTLLQGKAPEDEAAVAVPDLKCPTLAKTAEEIPDLSRGAKGKALPAQEIFAPARLKSGVVDKFVQPLATTFAGSKARTAGGVDMMEVGMPEDTEAAADNVSPSVPTAGATSAKEATGEDLVPHVSVADGDHPLVSNDDGPVALKGTETAGRDKVGASAKKTARILESAATSKAVQKTIATVGNVITGDAKPVAGSSVDGAIVSSGQAIVFQSEKGEISKATDTFSKTIPPVSQTLVTVSPATLDGVVRKQIVPRPTAGDSDIESTMTAGNDLASPVTGISSEKTATVTIPGGAGGNKPQVAPESVGALLHFGGIAPTTVVSGSTPAESVATKLPVGDAGVHAAGLSAGLREQDGTGGSAQPTDGATRMLVATPTSLEVGIQNGTHGWLKVRAEMTDGGVVNASVAATSSSGQEMLHRELPALTAYLQEEKVGVNAVVIHAPSTVGVDARSSSGTDGAGGHAQQRSNEREEPNQNFRGATLNGSSEALSYRSSRGADEDGSLPLAAYASGGNWLSVRA